MTAPAKRNWSVVRRGAGYRTSPGLQDILDAEGGPTYRQVDYWVSRGWLSPDRTQSDGDRVLWSWPQPEQRVAVLMARLYNAGLRPEVAARVARFPMGGLVVLAPQIILSVFEIKPRPEGAPVFEYPRAVPPS